ncbi:hypothetical protein C1645_821228 [Glomus cerebriforme]|uniref:Uncharacterized protein n=1 Tax=Glomus cerebriforme TaxID=658196 RepID=A0A397T174_9GLOM|nr:hypothetical protein C1645_821228 [Glomus cerebriforme]
MKILQKMTVEHQYNYSELGLPVPLKQKFVLNFDSLENSFQKLDMHNKSVAKNKCQYIEVDANVEQELQSRIRQYKKNNKLSFSPKKLISNKLNTQKFHKKYGIAGPLSRTSQKPVFITSSDENEENKKKVNKKKAKNKKQEN